MAVDSYLEVAIEICLKFHLAKTFEHPQACWHYESFLLSQLPVHVLNEVRC